MLSYWKWQVFKGSISVRTCCTSTKSNALPSFSIQSTILESTQVTNKPKYHSVGCILLYCQLIPKTIFCGLKSHCRIYIYIYIPTVSADAWGPYSVCWFIRHKRNLGFSSICNIWVNDSISLT
jgi:hypothetical protein